MSPSARRLLFLLPFFFASSAVAEPLAFAPNTDTYFNIGPLLSLTGRPNGAMTAVGAEASVHHFVGHDFAMGFGLFGQFQVTTQQHTRLCAGVQGSLRFAGLELGIATENESQRFASTTSFHVAPFLSMGFATASLRVDIPIPGPEERKPGYGSDIGLVLALKLPLGFEGH